MAETMSFIEAQDWAASIHPDAKARLNWDDTWEIVIETPIQQAYAVHPLWADTPAEKKFNTFDVNGDGLTEWAKHAGHKNEPLDIVALRYNLTVKYAEFIENFIDEQLAETALPLYADMAANSFAGVSSEEMLHVVHVRNLALQAGKDEFDWQKKEIQDLLA